MLNGTTKSCTCLRKDINSSFNITHGQTGSKTYRIWDGMKRRCNDPKNPQFHYYGGRGIKVCDKWLSFAGFFEDMGECPPKFTIERIDSNGHYEKKNCVWATMTDNLRNRSSVKLNLQKVHEIKQLLQTKSFTQKQIGQRYNVDPSIISNIHTNKYWKTEV